MELQKITNIWNQETADKINGNFENVGKMKSEIYNELSSQEITWELTGLPITQRTSTKKVNNWGVAFQSKVSSFITGFSVYSTKEGLVEFYMTDFPGENKIATIEYKRVSKLLDAGWNRVEFIVPIKANQSYALACKFIDKDLELTASGSSWTNDKNMQNTHLIQPLKSYYPYVGNTSTAYFYFFDIEIANSTGAMIMANQKTSKFFEVSDIAPTNDSILWIRPKGE